MACCQAQPGLEQAISPVVKALLATYESLLAPALTAPCPQAKGGRDSFVQPSITPGPIYDASVNASPKRGFTFGTRDKVKDDKAVRYLGAYAKDEGYGTESPGVGCQLTQACANCSCSNLTRRCSECDPRKGTGSVLNRQQNLAARLFACSLMSSFVQVDRHALTLCCIPAAATQPIYDTARGGLHLSGSKSPPRIRMATSKRDASSKVSLGMAQARDKRTPASHTHVGQAHDGYVVISPHQPHTRGHWCTAWCKVYRGL